MATIEIYNSEFAKSCILCGAELTKLDEPIKTHCDHCGKTGEVEWQCVEGHNICKECMKLDAIDFIKQKCLNYKGNDPMELAVDIMNSPVIRMHGPEHHFIVPAVMTTCIHNEKRDRNNLSEKLDIAEKRAQTETPNHCTYKIGTCGAALGTGVFVSMLLDRPPEAEDAWSPTNLVVAESLKNVAASEGPRCCKRDTYIAIESAVEFLKERFAIDLPMSKGKCTFSVRNRTCGHEECEYYSISNSLV